MIRVLVGVMYCGESEYDQCIESLRMQQDVVVDHFVVENQPNKIAHDLLYKTFNENSADYDFLAKLDADMVLTKEDVMQKICGLMQSDSLDHLMIDVKDFLSDIFIPGFNTYAKNVTWSGNDDSLIVDYHGTANKTRRINNLHFVDHMPSPSEYQSFCYGLHKALKAIQPGRKKDLPRAVVHWTIISQIVEAFLREPNILRAYALFGAHLIFTSKELQRITEYKGDEIKTLFDEQILSFVENHLEEIRNDWSNPLTASGKWITALHTS